MLWYVCFFAVIAFAMACILLKICLSDKKRKNGLSLNTVQLLFAGSFFTGFAICFPSYMATYPAENLQVFKAVVFSLNKAVRVFGANDLCDVVFEAAQYAPGWLGEAYSVLALLVQLLAPLLTFGFVLSFFKNVSAYIQYLISFFCEAYVFSSLNERSIMLAKDLKQHHPRARIIFTDAFGGSKDQQANLIEKAWELDAICFKKSIVAVNWKRHSAKKKVHLFAIGEDEALNVDQALQLIDLYNTCANVQLYVFSRNIEGELVLADKEKGQMKVRRVNQVRAMILHTLHESGTQFFENARTVEGQQEKQITAVIVGMGEHGKEMLKALSWYCQMDGYRLRIHAFDKDKLAEEKFAAQCPELMDKMLNGEGKEYDIRIHAGCDAESKQFAEIIKQMNDASYVFVSRGTDECNIQTAANLRMLFARNDCYPQICAVLRKSGVKKNLSDVKNYAGQPYCLTFLGEDESVYSEAVIIDSKVEQDAYGRHCSYCKGDKNAEEDFWRYEYCYRSSMAVSIHAVARKACGIPGAGKKASEQTEAEKSVIEALEHRRWKAYMRSEGYIYSKTKNPMAKTHHNLMEYKGLSGDDQEKSGLVSTSA